MFVFWRHSTQDMCLMLGSPDSSEPVRHVSNVSKLRVLACSGITGPLCAAVAAVLAKLSSSHCSCQAALQLSAIFQRTSNPEVKAKAATHKTISVLNIILISLIIIVMTEVLDPEALAVACPEELSTADAAAFRFLPESGCLACHPAARRSWQANDFMTFVQSCFVTPRPH